MIIWLILGVVLIIYAVFTIILNYHWKRYGKDNKAIKAVKGIYFIVSLVLLLSAIVSALLFIEI
ncbi:MAG: hypothetical protein ACLFTS_01185 [Candidatus Paceibacterota bacterium]